MRAVFIICLSVLIIRIECGLLNDLVDSKSEQKKNEHLLPKVVKVLDDGSEKLVETVSSVLNINLEKDKTLNKENKETKVDTLKPKPDKDTTKAETETTPKATETTLTTSKDKVTEVTVTTPVATVETPTVNKDENVNDNVTVSTAKTKGCEENGTCPDPEKPTVETLKASSSAAN